MTPNYTSYMLRIQLKKSGDESVWVASLQSTKTGELRWFPTIEVLIQFLQDEFCGQNEIVAPQPSGYAGNGNSAP